MASRRKKGGKGREAAALREATGVPDAGIARAQHTGGDWRCGRDPSSRRRGFVSGPLTWNVPEHYAATLRPALEALGLPGGALRLRAAAVTLGGVAAGRSPPTLGGAGAAAGGDGDENIVDVTVRPEAGKSGLDGAALSIASRWGMVFRGYNVLPAHIAAAHARGAGGAGGKAPKSSGTGVGRHVTVRLAALAPLPRPTRWVLVLCMAVLVVLAGSRWGVAVGAVVAALLGAFSEMLLFPAVGGLSGSAFVAPEGGAGSAVGIRISAGALKADQAPREAARLEISIRSATDDRYRPDSGKVAEGRVVTVPDAPEGGSTVALYCQVRQGTTPFQLGGVAASASVLFLALRSSDVGKRVLDNLGCASSIDATPLEVAGSRNVVLRLILKFDKDVLLEGLRMSVGGDAVAEGVKQHLAGAADWSFDMQGFSSLPLPELSSAKEPSAGKVAVSMDASITHPTFDVVDECESQTAFTSCSDFAAAVVDRVVGRQRNAVRKDLELAFQNDAARDAMVDGQSWLEGLHMIEARTPMALVRARFNGCTWARLLPSWLLVGDAELRAARAAAPSKAEETTSDAAEEAKDDATAEAAEKAEASAEGAAENSGDGAE